jgi:hypothetical protein
MMVVMLRLGGCNRGTAKREQAENDKHSGEKTLYAIHVHVNLQSCQNLHFQLPGP